VDTALRTADAGYLTRRLVDVAHDVIIREVDCKTTTGVLVRSLAEIESLAERIRGRTSLHDITDPKTGEQLIAAGCIFSEAIAKRVEEVGIDTVEVRSVLKCESRKGVCAKCYGEDLATHKTVEVGVAIGLLTVIAISFAKHKFKDEDVIVQCILPLCCAYLRYLQFLNLYICT
jgi:DNA-directed RNA polymerase subunit beta'